MCKLPSRSPTSDQSVHEARTHFHEKRGIFFMGGANSQKPEKGPFFGPASAKLKKKKYCMYLFPFGFSFGHLLCINVFELQPYARSNEKYDIHGKMPWVWYRSGGEVVWVECGWEWRLWCGWCGVGGVEWGWRAFLWGYQDSKLCDSGICQTLQVFKYADRCSSRCHFVND